MNKTNYIIPALILCFSLIFLSSPLKSDAGTSKIYYCSRCTNLGKCGTESFTTPCSDNCSGCEKHTCKVCSGGSCISKTYSSTCSDKCTNNSECGSPSLSGKYSCYRCTSGGQCMLETFSSSCSDECTGPSQCTSGGSTGDRKRCHWSSCNAQNQCVAHSKTQKASKRCTKSTCSSDADCGPPPPVSPPPVSPPPVSPPPPFPLDGHDGPLFPLPPPPPPPQCKCVLIYSHTPCSSDSKCGGGIFTSITSTSSTS